MRIRSKTIQLVSVGTLILAAFHVGGCGKKDPASCRAVAAHVIDMARTELAKDGDADRLKVARANLPTLQNALVVACEDKKWSESSRRCIAEAKTPAETNECDPDVAVPGTQEAKDAAPPTQSR